MKLTTINNSYLSYTLFDDRIDIDYIQSCAPGDGSTLLKKIKGIAKLMNLPIELYSEPQDDTICKKKLNRFYEKNGFVLHPDDVDFSYYILKP